MVSDLSTDHDALGQALNEKAGRSVQLTQDVRGQRARWLSLAKDNAALNLRSHLADKSHMLARFQNLQDAVGLDEMPQRLGRFDISHTMGEATVASCVVFDTSGRKILYTGALTLTESPAGTITLRWSKRCGGVIQG